MFFLPSMNEKMTKADILENTAKEYYETGAENLEKKRYNSAVVLFFKALVALSDLFLLQQTGETPSSHTDRFKVTKEKFPEVYNLLDKDFPFYQDSYNVIMTQELAEVIKDDAREISRKTKRKIIKFRI